MKTAHTNAQTGEKVPVVRSSSGMAGALSQAQSSRAVSRNRKHGTRRTPGVQIRADDNEEAFTETVANPRCVWHRVDPDHLSVKVVHSAIAFAVTVEIVDPAKQARSVHKVHGHLALAESYRDTRAEAKQNLETILEYIPPPRRWHVFSLTTKPA